MNASIRSVTAQEGARLEPRARLARRIRVPGAAWSGSVHPRSASGGLGAQERAVLPDPVCQPTVGVRQRNGASTSVVIVRLDGRRAELIAPRLAVEVGEMVWLVLELGNARPYTVVLTCSVTTAENGRVGLSFVGLPEDEPAEGHEDEGAEERGEVAAVAT